MTGPNVHFEDFLEAVARALDARVNAGAAAVALVFDPAIARASKPGEVFVGLGDLSPTQGGICINQKNAGAALGLSRDPICVAQLAEAAGETLVEAWRASLGTGEPGKVLETAQLVVEDASPDSVLGFLLLMARLAGVPPERLPRRWIAAVTAWERDGSAASPMTSWSVLVSALAHSHFGRRAVSDNLSRAWGDALRFTVHCLQRGLDPDGIDPSADPGLLAEAAYVRAVAFVNGERQDYLQSLARATRVELLMPMAGAVGRDLSVEGYFAIESPWPSGVKKVFIRTDRENTAGGMGFALMGLYRPDQAGTGNDIVISVDPRQGINLEALWRELERLENEAWANARPRQRERRIASYPPGQGYEQPWWDDSGRYTLIAAPKALADGALGSKLIWSDVLEAVWRCYQPLRDIAVFDLHGATPAAAKPITHCVARRFGPETGGETKCLLAAKWDRSAGATQALQFTPTVKRLLAALASRPEAPPEAPVKLSDLPDPSDFEFLELAGGSAVVTRDGAFLFDDWRNRDLDAAHLTADFAAAVTLVNDARAFDGEVDALYAAAAADENSFWRSAKGDVLTKIISLRARIARTFQRAALSGDASDRSAFRSAVERLWGLANKEAELTSRLKDLQEILETAATLRTQGMATIIGFAAIPAFVTSALALYTAVVDRATQDSGRSQDGLYTLAMTVLIFAITGGLYALASYLTRKKS